LGFGVWGLGFGVWGLGFRVWGLGFGVWGVGFGAWNLGSGCLGLGFGDWVLVGVCGLGFGFEGFGVWDLGFGVWGLEFRGSDKANLNPEACEKLTPFRAKWLGGTPPAEHQIFSKSRTKNVVRVVLCS